MAIEVHTGSRYCKILTLCFRTIEKAFHHGNARWQRHLYEPPMNPLSLNPMNQAVRVFAAIVACLVTTAAQAQVMLHLRLETVDLVGGNPISQIAVGEEFRLDAYVQDVRPDPEFGGVFSAFVDLPFNANLATAVEPLVFGDFFNLIQKGTISPGLVSTVGAATAAHQPPGVAEQYLFSVVFHADHSGQLVLSPQFPASPFGEFGLYGDDDLLLPEQVMLTGTSINIVPEPPSMALAACAAVTLGLMVRRRSKRSSRE